MRSRLLFVALGNPGAGYRGTRHNVGFDWLDHVAEELSLKKDFKEKFEAEWLQFEHASHEVHFLKPQTYMNLSGKSLGLWKKKFQGDFEIRVILDDIDLPLGRIKLAATGRDAGHRGMRSLIQVMGTPDIPRMKIGVGRPTSDSEAKDHVLESFNPDEKKVMNQVYQVAKEHFDILCESSLGEAMNQINGWRASV